MTYRKIESTSAMWFQSSTMFFNADSWKTTKLETNKCTPYVLNQICEMHTSEGQRDARKAQCNSIGRKICFNDDLLRDCPSDCRRASTTHLPTPSIHDLHIKCEHSPLAAENWHPEQDYGGDIPFVIQQLWNCSCDPMSG